MDGRMGGCWVAVGSSWPLTPFLNGSCMPVTATHPLILCYYFTTLPYFANILPHHNGNMYTNLTPSLDESNMPVTELLSSTHHITSYYHVPFYHTSYYCLTCY